MSIRDADDISGNENGNNDNNENTPVAKKLRSSPTDLIIKIGEEGYEFHCHSMIMAHHSDFIDAALASPMIESQNRIIEFRDITPRIWGVMMKLVESPPTKSGEMDDLIMAAKKLDQYQFVSGIAVCGKIVSTTFKEYSKMLQEDPFRLRKCMRKLIEYAIECDKIQLKYPKNAIADFFRRALTLPEEAGNHCSGLIFTEEYLKLLAPLIAQDNLVAGNRWTKEEIVCPLFPKHFLASLMKDYEEKRFGPICQRKPMIRAALRLDQSGAKRSILTVLNYKGNRHNGDSPYFLGTFYQREGIDLSPQLENTKLMVKKSQRGDWVIAARLNNGQNNQGNVERWQKIWRCPMSFNFAKYPPKGPWINVNDMAPIGTLSVSLED